MEKLFKRVIYDQMPENFNKEDDYAMAASESDPDDDESFASEDNDEDYVESIRSSCKRFETQNGVAKKNPSRKSNKANTKTSLADENNIARKPTRRPDPRVSNRNALMARENRRRKKEMFEQMEQRFSEIQMENKNLRRLTKRQGSTIKKLHNETLYLKSVITNRTQISQLLKSIGSSNIPITSSTRQSKLGKSSETINGTIKYSPATPDSIDDSEYDNNYGSVKSDPLLSESAIFNDTLNTFPFTDVMASGEEKDCSPGYSSEDTLDADNISTSFDNGWENLLNYDSISNIPIFEEGDNLKSQKNNSCSDIVSEHNYHSNVDKDMKTVEPGICLHISSGRVSLEFCATCHNSAQQTEIDEY